MFSNLSLRGVKGFYYFFNFFFLRPEEENIIIDIRKFFRLKKELHYTVITGIRNIFRHEKNKAIKDRIIRNIKNLFEHEEEGNYYKPARVSKFWSNGYIEYESNGDKSKTLLVEEYLNKIIWYLKEIISNIKKFDKWWNRWN